MTLKSASSLEGHAIFFTTAQLFLINEAPLVSKRKITGKHISINGDNEIDNKNMINKHINRHIKLTHAKGGINE